LCPYAGGRTRGKNLKSHNLKSQRKKEGEQAQTTGMNMDGMDKGEVRKFDKMGFLRRMPVPVRLWPEMVRVAQLVRASDCGSEGRGFESRLSPIQ
jgi:hypothetical protein